MYFKKKKAAAAPKVFTPDEALLKLESYCAYQERAPKEVREKLKSLGMQGSDARQIYQALERDGFFDEGRFARAFAGGKFRVNHWGRVRIRLELRMRDISPETIAEALEAIEQEEYERVLSEILQKKMRQYDGDHNARDKAAASLIRAGFEPDLVFAALKHLPSPEPTEE